MSPQRAFFRCAPQPRSPPAPRPPPGRFSWRPLLTPRLLNEQVELVALDQLRPHPENPNQGHPEAIAQSIRLSGWWGTVTAQRNTGRILVGEHRWKGARLAGLTHVPVFWVDVDDDQARVILLADNRYAELATRDPDALRALLEQVQRAGQLEGTGYSRADLQALIAELDGEVSRELLTDEDDAPALQERHVAQPGDLWTIGEHRVGCGDSTDPAQLRRVLGDQLADVIWTDPPYNVNYEGKTKARLKIENDAMSPEQFRVFMGAAMNAMYAVIKPGGCLYVAYAELEGATFRVAFDGAGFKYSQTLVWVKNAAVMSRQDYNWRHEPLLYGWKPGAGHYFAQDFTNTTVLDHSVDLASLSKTDLVAHLQAIRDASTGVYEKKPNRNDLHPTMKPVALVRKLLVNSSRPGELVLDPFGGSGTTLIAAHQSGRMAALNELDPHYVDQIIRRAQEATGMVATRQDGATFHEVAREVAV
ncbi:DNA modification methylase [Deinococcus multiflagellatus]|uniref:DNA methyltransferase n=1 Tax=Deinococcus multiflagellatus TaxID=1656887 RepID=A0ABW1ZUF8_9DEIO|nr:DNA modification methylase [Deinococcus multiflagellatus]MBZ9715508.1 DNA modification methylase [Deinococcus multiflagellatus]